MKEQKQFELASSRRPRTIDGLHNTVLVYRAENAPIEYGYIRFSQALINAVGQQLPQGVSSFNPAFLQVHFEKGSWVVSACYLHKNVRRILWISVDFPAWLKELKKVGVSKNVLARQTHRPSVPAVI